MGCIEAETSRQPREIIAPVLREGDKDAELVRERNFHLDVVLRKYPDERDTCYKGISQQTARHLRHVAGQADHG